MNEETPKFEGENKPEEDIEIPEEQAEQMPTEDIKAIENLRRASEAQDKEDLKEVRTELGLPTDGPGVENPENEPIVVEDVLAKARAKGLVFEMDEVKDTPEFRDKIDAVNAKRNDLKGEELYRAADEHIANLNASPETNPSAPENTTEQSTPQQKLEKALESGDARQIDHASYPIFKEARNNEDWPLAIEMIQHARPGDARNGRIGVVRKEMEKAGQTYNGPAESTPEKTENPKPQEELLGTTEIDIDKNQEQQITGEGIQMTFDLKDADESIRQVFVEKFILKAKKEAEDFIESNIGTALNKEKAIKLIQDEIGLFLNTRSEDFISSGENVEKIGCSYNIQWASFEDEEGEQTYITGTSISDYIGNEKINKIPGAENIKNEEKLSSIQKLEKALESGDTRQIDHASYPIFKEARNNKNWPLAIEMIQHARPGDARNGRIGVVRKEMEKAGQTYNGPEES